MFEESYVNEKLAIPGGKVNSILLKFLRGQKDGMVGLESWSMET